MNQNKNGFLSRDTIKYIAMITMLLNHISHVFYGQSEAPAAILLRDIGYFTAPVMCFFMAEGFRYTSSRKKYALRLLAFAVLSQFSYYYAFTVKAQMANVGLNMMYTLLLGFLTLIAETQIRDQTKKNLAIAGLVLLSIPGDWSVFAPVFILLFYRAGQDGRQIRKVYGIFAAAFGLGTFLSALETYSFFACCMDAIGSALVVLLAGVVIGHCYHGRPAKHGRAFSKWFFYCFYPLHLLVLGFLK